MESEGLGLDRVVEIIAEALPGFGAEIVTVGLRRAENSELHPATLLKNRNPSTCDSGAPPTGPRKARPDDNSAANPAVD